MATMVWGTVLDAVFHKNTGCGMAIAVQVVPVVRQCRFIVVLNPVAHLNASSPIWVHSSGWSFGLFRRFPSYVRGVRTMLAIFIWR